MAMVFQRHTLIHATLAAGVIALGLSGCAMHKSMGTTAGGGSAGTSGSRSSMQVYTATLSPSEEVPPAANSKGQGTAEVTVDPSTNELTWKVSYSGLTGPATMGHIHGPAGPGKNAGVVVPFTGVAGAQSAQGTGKLTQAQYGDLAAGMYYVNIHTAQYPAGEIRGQLHKRP